jgi:hypothetical protein
MLHGGPTDPCSLSFWDMPKRLIIDGFSGFSSVAPSDPAEIDATREGLA